MLRNWCGCRGCGRAVPRILNEVLSLNAQESQAFMQSTLDDAVLNEVLSLNAQESPPRTVEGSINDNLLNEVLSLNAQELPVRVRVRILPCPQ